MMDLPPGVEITRPDVAHRPEALTPDALAFVADLHRRFSRSR